MAQTGAGLLLWGEGTAGSSWMGGDAAPGVPLARVCVPSGAFSGLSEKEQKSQQVTGYFETGAEGCLLWVLGLSFGCLV